MAELTQVGAYARPAQRVVAVARDYAITVAVAVVVFLVAYANGGFGESTRDTFAILLWWVLVLCVVLGVWPLARITGAAWVTGGLLAAFGGWTLLSVVWAADAAGAYAEFTRVMLYLAVFAVTVAGSRRDNAARWANGLALGIAAVAIVALLSRLFPGTLGNNTIARLLPEGQNRLSFPVGYWNGLAILLALGVPLLLRAATAGRSLALRGLAVAPIPVIAGVIYLASSRTGVASAVIGTVAFVLLTSSRWTALGATVAAAAGSAVTVLVLYNRGVLVNGPLGSATAESQGRSAFLIVLGVCVLTGVLYGVGIKAFRGGRRINPAVGWSLLSATVVIAVVGIVLAHPVRRFEHFKQPPVVFNEPSAIEQHFLSGGGNGRWQLWQAAWREFESKPVQGRGAGSYEAWWTQHGSVPGFVQDAHSLYLETLGELGIIGFVLLILAFAWGLVCAGRRLVRVPSDQRLTLASATASFLAFAFAAALDWMWELTIVSVVAFVCLGLVTGPATSPVERLRIPVQPQKRGRLSRYGLRVAGLVAGCLLICALAIPLVAGARIHSSQQASERGNLAAALRDARGARSIQPWSPAPYQQLALLEEQAYNYDAAHTWILRAIARDDSDWRLWLTRARIEAELGRITAARRSLHQCRILHPRGGICLS